MEAVRRSSDGELCGHVLDGGNGRWRALTVFGAVLGTHPDRSGALEQVLDDGLASLTRRWTLRHPATGREEVVCIQEVNGSSVTVARGYYSLPGVPTLTITMRQIVTGEWDLRLEADALPPS